LAAPAIARQACVEAPTSALVINVRDKGAKGDGETDDTAAIQAAIDEVGGTGGTVLVPKGTYTVDAVGKKRLTLKGDMTLKRLQEIFGSFDLWRLACDDNRWHTRRRARPA
jgi:polygalacturonase